MAQRDELEDRITELTVKNATAYLRAINADLLAALKAMLPESWEPADYLNNRKRAMDMARAAIEKAEGK